MQPSAPHAFADTGRLAGRDANTVAWSIVVDETCMCIKERMNIAGMDSDGGQGRGGLTSHGSQAGRM